MSEPMPVYAVPVVADEVLDLALQGSNGAPNPIVVYLERRREALIVELRAIDRALKRPQTIPERRH